LILGRLKMLAVRPNKNATIYHTRSGPIDDEELNWARVCPNAWLEAGHSTEILFHQSLS
jgi:hypothetical protein